MIAMATVMIVILIEGMMAIVVVMMALNKCYLPPYIFFSSFYKSTYICSISFRQASPGVQTAVKQLVQRQELYIGQLERELAFCRFQP